MTSAPVATPHDEPRWPAAVALVLCALLYVILPSRLVVGPHWVLPVLIVVCIIPLSLRRHRRPDDHPMVRRLTLLLLTLVTLANITSVILLIERLLDTSVTGGRALIFSAIAIWLTNIIGYGVWFWEIDRGGPHVRASGVVTSYDLQFPQLENPSLAPPHWSPSLWDYLYTAFANGTSFAPADAMPLSARMKFLFMSESVISLMTISIVAARAVNILK